jgi:Zn-dependent peptidase ImmA (M78 family)/transcriptional regulator with XRE-family HTH domain
MEILDSVPNTRIEHAEDADMDSASLGRRLRDARERQGLTQQAVSERIGIARTAITQIESGQRKVSTLELTKLADLFGRTASYFLKSETDFADQDFRVILYRSDPDVQINSEAIERCVDLCRIGTSLEKKLGRESIFGPPSFSLSIPRSAGEAVAQGADIAEGERRRLGIGNGPVVGLAHLLCNQGVWAAATQLPEEVSGLFVHESSFGLMVLVNDSQAAVRKRFSYAHEYAHALMDRGRTVQVTSVRNSSDLIEKRANAFAATFLMPSDGVQQLLHTLDKGRATRQQQVLYDVATDDQFEAENRPAPRSQRITFQEAAIVAHHFGVSYDAAVYRLNNLSYINHIERNDLLNQRDTGKKYLKLLAATDDVDGDEQKSEQSDRELSWQIVHLVIEAYRREEISQGRLMEISRKLGVPGESLLDFAETAREM